MSFWKITLLKSKVNCGLCLVALAWHRIAVETHIADGNA